MKSNLVFAAKNFFCFQNMSEDGIKNGQIRPIHEQNLSGNF